jgi:hypothetical protein
MYNTEKIQKALFKLEAKANLLNDEKYYHKYMNLINFCKANDIQIKGK